MENSPDFDYSDSGDIVDESENWNNWDIVDDTDQVEWDEVSAARWFASIVQK